MRETEGAWNIAEQLQMAHSVEALATLYSSHLADQMASGQSPDMDLMDAAHKRLVELSEITSEDSRITEKLTEYYSNYIQLVSDKLTERNISKEDIFAWKNKWEQGPEEK